MAIKLEIEGNYFIITDTTSNKTISETPSKNTYYIDENSRVVLFSNVDTYPKKIGSDSGYLYTELVDADDNPFGSHILLIQFLRDNTGFNTASGRSEAVNIVQQVEGFSDLIAGTLVGELAYVETAEGTAWLPGTIGGSYYPKGWYLWNGAEWTSDRNAIAESLDYLYNNTPPDSVGVAELKDEVLALFQDKIKTLDSNVIDWSNPYGTLLRTFTGTPSVTFTETNTPVTGTKKTITIYMTGAVSSMALPTTNTYIKMDGSADYNGTKMNLYVFEFVNGNVYYSNSLFTI